MTTGRHANTFDFLRLVAATVVVIAHAQDNLDSPFLWNASWIVDGVAMFFVMSGMLVFRSAERSVEVTGGFREYARNRFLRVAPAIYAFALALPLIFVVLTDIRFRDLLSLDSVVWLATSAALAPNSHPAIYDGIGTGDINGHLYTIPAEVSFYVLVPFLIWFARRWSFNRMLLLALPVAVVAPIIANTTTGLIPRLFDHTFLELFAYFLVGVVWARYWDRAPKQWWIFALSLAAYVAVKVGASGTAIDKLMHPVLIAIPLSYCLIWFGYRGPKVLAGLTNRIGDISFGTYIWHVPVMVLFAEYGWTRDWWVVPGVVLGGWLMGGLSWWLVEKRFLRRKRVSERVAETGHVVPEVDRDAATTPPGESAPRVQSAGAGSGSPGQGHPSAQ